jgi:hypothetical protein
MRFLADIAAMKREVPPAAMKLLGARSSPENGTGIKQE